MNSEEIKQLKEAMRQVALANLIKTVRAAPGQRIKLTREDFVAIDEMDDKDQWTMENDGEGNVLIGLLKAGRLS